MSGQHLVPSRDRHLIDIVDMRNIDRILEDSKVAAINSLLFFCFFFVPFDDESRLGFLLFFVKYRRDIFEKTKNQKISGSNRSNIVRLVRSKVNILARYSQ